MSSSPSPIATAVGLGSARPSSFGAAALSGTSASSPSDAEPLDASPSGPPDFSTAGSGRGPPGITPGTSLEEKGVRRASVTLHVGLDTFRPLEGEFVDEHEIHREWYEVPPATREAMATTRAGGGRVVAVGTTAVRVLETAGRTEASSGWTDLYITPPYRFAAVDALVTNFHLPRSSLLLLVSAFVQSGMAAGAGPYDARDVLLHAYRAALDEGYRFFSFGDAMLIL